MQIETEILKVEKALRILEAAKQLQREAAEHRRYVKLVPEEFTACRSISETMATAKEQVVGRLLNDYTALWK